MPRKTRHEACVQAFCLPMGIAEFYYIEGGLLFGFVVAVGLTVISLNRYRIAKWCAVVAAILFASIAVVWGITTAEAQWVRVLAVGIIGFIAAAGLSKSLRFINKQEHNNPITQASRIVITKYILTPVTPSDPKSDLAWHIYMLNHGTIPGYAPQFTFMSRLTDGILTDTEIDDGMHR